MRNFLGKAAEYAFVGIVACLTYGVVNYAIISALNTTHASPPAPNFPYKVTKVPGTIYEVVSIRYNNKSYTFFVATVNNGVSVTKMEP